MSDRMPSAHAVYIERRTAFPEYYNNKNDSNTIQAEIQDENIPEAVPIITGTSVITETKRTPSLFNPFGYTNKDLDIDISLFKNTCLKDIVLTDTEIGMLKDKLGKIKNRKQFIQNNMPYYCDIRDLILSQMPDFYEKYPSLFSQVLSKCLEIPRNESFINTIVSLVTERNFNELNKREKYIVLHPGSENLSLKLDKYKLIPTLLPKNKTIGGMKRKRKSKNNRASRRINKNHIKTRKIKKSKRQLKNISL
jgi:hypothetical protein